MGTRKESGKQSILSIHTGEKCRHKAPATEIYNEIKRAHEVHCICYCQGNGKVSAQGLLVPIASNGNKYPRMCPHPLINSTDQALQEGSSALLHRVMPHTLLVPDLCLTQRNYSNCSARPWLVQHSPSLWPQQNKTSFTFRIPAHA